MLLRSLLNDCDRVLEAHAREHPDERATIGKLRFRMKCADAALLQASSLLGIDPPSDDRPVRGTAAETSGEAASAAVGAAPPLLTDASKARIVFECHSAGCAAFFDLDSARGIHNGHGIVRCPRCWSTSVRVGLRPNVRKAGVA
jgi:hypothetical protein